MKRSLCVLSVLLLAVFLLACAALAVPAPRPSLKEWDDPINPDHDCKIWRDKDFLSIEMPGTEHEFDPLRDQFNAPRIFREIEGEFDLQVRVRIECPRSAQSSAEDRPAYVSAGFLIIYPDSPWYASYCNRWDYGFMQQRVGIDAFPDKPRFAPSSQIEEESRKGIGEDGFVLLNYWNYDSMAMENGVLIVDRRRFQSGPLFLLDRGWPYWPLQGRADCVYLRLNLEDKQIRFSLSPNGVKWPWPPLHRIWAGRPKNLKVGLAAYSTSTEPSKVRFDQIKLWRDKKKER